MSNDLVEDAFITYLKKLEELAQLEIVTMYCEEKAINPAQYRARHRPDEHRAAKYFYRQYAQRMWTPWEPMGVEIESDHVAAVMWRERLHVFWVTFMEKPKRNTATAAEDPFTGSESVAQVANKVTKTPARRTSRSSSVGASISKGNGASGAPADSCWQKKT